MSSKKIIIIEDDLLISKMMETKLKNMLPNCDITRAFNGEEGLKSIKQNMPDLILLDLAMPKKNGFQVLEEMKKSNLLGKIKIIILTNLGHEDDRKTIEEIHQVPYFIKSDTNIETITQLIAETLNEGTDAKK